ncbi:4749_t:CDS:2 [Entrophospora sp. SA101]|nr:7659_t:CDS:2 [Entrophospora sp. SA101]CAJ0763124.1 7219_t:CDS:2 [Entrophospora sp. SA101]CAJ0763332.1 4749_t:CDS:2 [Entrophospora sp. SA101]
MSDTTDQTNLINHNDNQTATSASPSNDHNDNSQGLTVPTSNTQYKLSRSEVVHGIANRIIYSRFYTWLYLGMAILSFTSIVLSFVEEW